MPSIQKEAIIMTKMVEKAMRRRRRSYTALFFPLLASSLFLLLLSAVVSAAIEGAFCGQTWSLAISTCNRPCPSGAPSECFEGETCYAGTPCSFLQQQTTTTSKTNRPTVRPTATSSAVVNPNIAANTYNNNNSPLYNAVATCGGGTVGNGLCPQINECCSQYGFCGTTDSHCSNRAPVSGVDTSSLNTLDSSTPSNSISNSNEEQTFDTSQQQQQQQQTAEGTCGGGSVGNGICPNNDECCSQYGFCGTSLEHCVGKDVEANNADAGGGGEGSVPVQQPQFEGEYGGTTMGNINGGGLSKPISQGGGGGGSSNTVSAVAPHGTDKKIIGYYAGWQWYDRNKLADPANIDFRKLQRVNFAFFQFDRAGQLFGTDRWGDPQVLFGPYSSMTGGGVQKCSYDGPNEVNCEYHEYNSGLVYRAHQAGAEVYPSIGGWTLSDNFPTVAANPIAREDFAENCLKIVKHYQFDGIDIDWEYPGYADHSGTVYDKENYTMLLMAIKYRLDTLSTETGKTYGLTAALPCNPQHIDNIEVDKLVNILTEFNLMSYDLFGAWDEVTGANAPLYHQGFGNDEFNIHACVENYVSKGVPRKRINIGLPFYGRSFKHASGLNQPHDGSDVASWSDDEGTPQFYNIYNKLPYMIQMRDNKGKTQYAYIKHDDPKLPSGGEMLPEGLVSFDDERSICDKVNYAQQKSLGGFIIWELSGDILDDLRTPLLDVTNKKLGNPSFHCCMLHSLEECEKERLEDEKKEQYQGYSNSFGFDTNTWGDNIRLSGSLLVSPSAFLMLVIGLVSVEIVV